MRSQFLFAFGLFSLIHYNQGQDFLSPPNVVQELFLRPFQPSFDNWRVLGPIQLSSKNGLGVYASFLILAEVLGIRNNGESECIGLELTFLFITNQSTFWFEEVTAVELTSPNQDSTKFQYENFFGRCTIGSLMLSSYMGKSIISYHLPTVTNGILESNVTSVLYLQNDTFYWTPGQANWSAIPSQWWEELSFLAVPSNPYSVSCGDIGYLLIQANFSEDGSGFNQVFALQIHVEGFDLTAYPIQSTASQSFLTMPVGTITTFCHQRAVNQSAYLYLVAKDASVNALLIYLLDLGDGWIPLHPLVVQFPFTPYSVIEFLVQNPISDPFGIVVDLTKSVADVGFKLSLGIHNLSVSDQAIPAQYAGIGLSVLCIVNDLVIVLSETVIFCTTNMLSCYAGFLLLIETDSNLSVINYEPMIPFPSGSNITSADQFFLGPPSPTSFPIHINFASRMINLCYMNDDLGLSILTNFQVALFLSSPNFLQMFRTRFAENIVVIGLTILQLDFVVYSPAARRSVLISTGLLAPVLSNINLYRYVGPVSLGVDELVLGYSLRNVTVTDPLSCDVDLWAGRLTSTTVFWRRLIKTQTYYANSLVANAQFITLVSARVTDLGVATITSLTCLSTDLANNQTAACIAQSNDAYSPFGFVSGADNQGRYNFSPLQSSMIVVTIASEESKALTHILLYDSIAGQSQTLLQPLALMINQLALSLFSTIIIQRFVEESSAKLLLKARLSCLVGYYSPNSTAPQAGLCVPCPPGSFANEIGSVNCTLCPYPQTTEGKGSYSVSQCRVCLPAYCHFHGDCFIGIDGAQCVCSWAYLAADRCAAPWIPIIILLLLTTGFAVIFAFYRVRRWRASLKLSQLEIQSELSELKSSWNIEWSSISELVRLDAGGFGTVYKATWCGRHVAVKIMHDSGVELFSDFEREMKTLRACRHPQIVLFFGIGRTNEDQQFLVTEFVELGSLRSLLDKDADDKHVHWSTRLSMAVDIVAGVEYLHRQSPPLMHRDIKSPNVLVTASLRCKLADLGTTRSQYSHPPPKAVTRQRGCWRPERNCRSRSVSSHLSENITSSLLPQMATNEVDNMSKRVGTTKWAAPELLRGDTSYGLAIDIYATGIVFWELATNDLPFINIAWSWDVTELVVQGERPRWPVEHYAESSPAYVHLTQRCWAQNPNERPTASEVLNILSLIT